MARNFTQLLSYSDIIDTDIDLIVDAFGYEYQHPNINFLLSKYSVTPSDEIVELILKKADLSI